MTTTIHSILEEFRSAATSNRDLGDKFERLLATYLVTDPLYQDNRGWNPGVTGQYQFTVPNGSYNVNRINK